MIWLAVLILFFSWAVPQPVPDEKELLREGLRLEQNGRYEQALQVWAKALTTLEKPSLAIGRAHIRLATEQQLSNYYEIASAMYQWGLSAEGIDENKEALKEELAMLEPLVEKKTYNLWQQLLERGNSQLYQELQLFWQSRDPTLVTTYNERLLEHWERIAYARNHFDRQDYSPYRTDDRGPVYVRYGKSDRNLSGFLNLSRGEVMQTCTGTYLPCNPQVMANIVTSLHTQPYYEIWIYNRPNTEMKYNLVFIFGEKPIGGFGLVETIDDFIQARAFTMTKRYDYPSLHSGIRITAGDKITPGMMMQYLYYKQLATKDFYFADQFSQMDAEWNRPHDPPLNPNLFIGKHAGPLKEQQHQMATIQNLNKAPEEVSTYEKAMPEIPLEVFQYRLLDEESRPVFATFLQSRSQPVFVNDLAANQDSMEENLPESATAADLFSYYELYHGLQLKDEEGQILSQYRMSAKLLLDSTNTVPSSSVFMVPFVSDNTMQLLYAELHNRHSYSNPIVDTPFPNSLRGLGRLEIEQPESLDIDPGTLEMGDLILGYQMQEAEGNTLFPFVVANDKKIPKDEDLAVHVETYHLQTDPAGIARFQLHYEILPVNWLGWTQERRQEFSLTLNLETDSNRYAEDLEIQTRVLEPGRYVLRMATVDQADGQEVKREVEFEVIE